MEKAIDCSIVIPVYNSEGTIADVCKRIDSVFGNLQQKYEIILVDDGSLDQSWLAMENIRQANPNVKTIQLMRNFGQHNAIMCGFNYVKGEYVITMDDDLQHPPEEITKMIRKIDDGYDVVYGIYESKQHGVFRNMGSKIIQGIYAKALGVNGGITSFRIIKRNIIERVIQYNRNFTFIDGLIVWHTKSIGYIKVEHKERKAGKTNYSFGKLLILSLNLFTNFSILPLQIASFLGIFFSGLGFIMALTYLIMRIFMRITVSGFATIIIAITIFSGVQLLILGLIGEYLGRVQLNINNKPQFSIREKHLD